MIVVFKSQELSDVLELQVMEKQEGQYLRRNYSFDQLHDLQSRLMLVAGKAALGKDDVDRFTLVSIFWCPVKVISAYDLHNYTKTIKEKVNSKYDKQHKS